MIWMVNETGSIYGMVWYGMDLVFSLFLVIDVLTIY
jgi:hypothetical protein